MIPDNDGHTPIYMQIAEWLELEILQERLPADERMYSSYQLADMFNINPATAAKGLTQLAHEGIVYEKRGVGRFVAATARDVIIQKRKHDVLQQHMTALIEEADRLGLSDEEWVGLLENMRHKRKGES